MGMVDLVLGLGLHWGFVKGWESMGMRGEGLYAVSYAVWVSTVRGN